MISRNKRKITTTQRTSAHSVTAGGCGQTPLRRSTAPPGRRPPLLCSPEKARQIAAHGSGKITKLYDRTSDQITLDEIERIVISTMLDGNCYIQLDCSPFNTMKSGGN